MKVVIGNLCIFNPKSKVFKRNLCTLSPKIEFFIRCLCIVSQIQVADRKFVHLESPNLSCWSQPWILSHQSWKFMSNPSFVCPQNFTHLESKSRFFPWEKSTSWVPNPSFSCHSCVHLESSKRAFHGKSVHLVTWSPKSKFLEEVTSSLCTSRIVEQVPILWANSCRWSQCCEDLGGGASPDNNNRITSYFLHWLFCAWILSSAFRFEYNCIAEVVFELVL